MPTGRKAIAEIAKDLRELGQPAFVQRYNSAALIGVGKVTNVIEQQQFSAQRTQVIAVPTTQEFEQAEATERVSNGTVKAAEWKVEASGNTNQVWFIPYSPTPQRLGRRQDNHIVIAEPSISSLHCNFRWSSLTALALTDSGASNGVWIGQKKLARGTAFDLKGGELILLGRFQFRFFYAAGLATYVRDNFPPPSPGAKV